MQALVEANEDAVGEILLAAQSRIRKD